MYVTVLCYRSMLIYLGFLFFLNLTFPSCIRYKTFKDLNSSINVPIIVLDKYQYCFIYTVANNSHAV